MYPRSEEIDHIIRNRYVFREWSIDKIMRHWKFTRAYVRGRLKAMKIPFRKRGFQRSSCLDCDVRISTGLRCKRHRSTHMAKLQREWAREKFGHKALEGYE